MELSKRYLLDTNTIIYLVNGRLALPLPDGKYSVSIITEIELLSFSGISAQEDHKIRDLLFLLERIQLTDAVRDETIRLRRNNKLKLPDAIIAASALTQDVVLLTNDHAFSSINGLLVQSLVLSQ
jgi:predicted nucleic acid-binding protein